MAKTKHVIHQNQSAGPRVKPNIFPIQNNDHRITSKPVATPAHHAMHGRKAISISIKQQLVLKSSGNGLPRIVDPFIYGFTERPSCKLFIRSYPESRSDKQYIAGMSENRAPPNPMFYHRSR
jgi:hypothetical protein